MCVCVPPLPPQDECRTLVDLSLADVEMPGQYMAGNEMTADSIVHLESISSNVTVVRRHCNSYRRLAFHGSDGHTRHFVVQPGVAGGQGPVDERMMQLLRLMNRLLDKSVEARRRALAWDAPVVVPVWPQIRMLQEEPSYISYGEAYEINCARFGREADQPIIAFKRRLAQVAAQLNNVTDGTIYDLPLQQRLAAYQEVAEKHVSENVFSQYIYKTLPTSNHLWAFKKNLCMQMALSGERRGSTWRMPLLSWP